MPTARGGRPVRIDHADVAQLAALPQRLPMPASVMMSNVAGEAARLAIRQALVPWLAVLHEVESTASAGGVTNLYENPVRLGVDRWCALIGARAITTAPCVVVMAGTATTVDTLDGDGRFLGGLILPGLELMRRSLARDTAALPLAAGKYSVYPRCTDDAITSGCIEAQAGAIERACARLRCGRSLPAFRRRGRRDRRASRRAASARRQSGARRLAAPCRRIAGSACRWQNQRLKIAALAATMAVNSTVSGRFHVRSGDQ